MFSWYMCEEYYSDIKKKEENPAICDNMDEAVMLNEMSQTKKDK